MIKPHLQSATVAFTGRKFDIRLIEIEGNDGRKHQREIVAHPGAATILPWLDDDHIVMIRNTRAAVDEELWELPAGTLEPAPETPQSCAARELVEETGYEAGRIEPLVEFYTSPGICSERMFSFVAFDLTHVGQALEPGERIRVEVVPWKETMQKVREGQITDGKTLATLLYYHAFKG